MAFDMENLILNDIEIGLLYLACINQQVAKSDIKDSHKAQLYQYAQKQQFEAISFIDKLLLGNPKFDFEYFAKRSTNYKNAVAVLEWLNGPTDTKPKKASKTKSLVSLIWDIEYSNLKKAYDYLKVYNFIDDKTTLEQFKAVFTGQPIETIQPIKWIETTTLLAYFLDNADIKQNYQSIVGKTGLFISKKDNPISASNLAASLSNFNKYGKPKGHEKIDKLLNDIQKH
jgi:hypothetical protein